MLNIVIVSETLQAMLGYDGWCSIMIYNFIITKIMVSSSDLEQHKLKFLLITSIFITGISVLAAHSTIKGMT
jgi:hypothetical protein